MKTLDKLALEEIENLAAEADLDPQTKLAHAAELRALRRLHQVAWQKRWALTRELERLPGVADVAAWKRLIADARAAMDVQNGAPDLIASSKQ